VIDLSAEQMSELIDDICTKDSLGHYNRFNQLCYRFGRWGRSWMPKSYASPLFRDYHAPDDGSDGNGEDGGDADCTQKQKLEPLSDDIGFFMDTRITQLRFRADLQLPYEAFYLTYMASPKERPKCLRRLVRHLRALHQDSTPNGIVAISDLFRENLRLHMLLSMAGN